MEGCYRDDLRILPINRHKPYFLTVGTHGYCTCLVYLFVSLSVCYHLIVNIARFYSISKVYMYGSPFGVSPRGFGVKLSGGKLWR